MKHEEEALFIRDLTVSCRTMGRGIGGALLTFIQNYAKDRNIPSIKGYVDETESNWRMRPLFEKRGFKELRKEQNRTFFNFEPHKDTIAPYPDHLEISHSFGS